MSTKHNDINPKPPTHVLTLYDYDPDFNEVHNQEEPDSVAPDISVRLSFKRGEK